jgi:hypothetical protein
MQHEGSVAASAKASVDLPHPEGPQIMITCVGPRDPDTLTWARAFFGIEERSERGTYAIVISRLPLMSTGRCVTRRKLAIFFV